MQRLFEIKDFKFTEDVISVTVSKELLSLNIDIKRKDFMLWLRVNDKLKYELNYNELPKSLTTTSGTISEQEYIQELGMPYVKDDLYEYISTHPIYVDGLIIEDTESFICEKFKNYTR